MAQLCKSCGSTKGSEAFIHPTTLKQGKTCADCIMKRSAAASSRPASDVGATLTDHAARLDDHETRIALVERTSSRADLAEWLELRDPSEPVGPGDLVECVDRKISREITGRGVLFIVSTEPFFTGNVPSDEVLPRGRAVAMIGQVPVKVRGAVRESQCLAASGEDDGTAVASDCPTGIVAMEAAEASDSFRLVRALVNAGSHAIAAPELTKKQKRRRARWAARKQKKQRAADEFVLVAADDNSEATDETDLDSLASSHSCVRTLLEQNRLLVEDKKQLYANVRGMRLLLRDPSARLLQRVGRGFVARRRAARVLRAAVKIQAASRASLKVAQRRALLRSVVSLQSRARVRRACAVLYHLQSVAASTTIASSARRYLVLTTTVVGKLLSRTRLQAIELECMKQDLERLRHSKVQQARDLREERNEWLAAVEKTKAQKAAELEKTKERLAAATAYVASLERASRAMLAAARRFARALATVPCDRTRVIGVVAHVDAGKTTLSEEMLALSGAITRSGRVDSGSTATDFLAQERARGITISSAAAHLDWRGTRVVLVDTPGHVDFGHDVDRALRVMDGVVLVVDAVAGAQARTEAVARAALETFGLPCVAVVNKMDRRARTSKGVRRGAVPAGGLRRRAVQRPVFDAAGPSPAPKARSTPRPSPTTRGAGPASPSAYRGSARPKEVLASSTGAVERPGQFLTPLGGGLEPAESWDAGDIVVLTGLRSARAGDTLVGPKGSPGFDAARRGAGLRLEAVDAPPPVFAVAAEPGSPSAAKALEAAAAILARDDPSLVVDVDGDTGQVVLRGLGELHLEVALERLRSDFGVDVTFGPPAVALREAPTAETRRPPFV
ncbi:Elongation factor G, domain IV [Aureococcus anophagefferens]|nr:Elongation factor G, domain IV [Aureococcus anophagefferens]